MRLRIFIRHKHLLLCSTDCMPALLRMTARITSSRMSRQPISIEADALKMVVADCDEAMVLLLQERAKATQMIAESRGAGTGVASAELSQEEVERIERANTPSENRLPVLKHQAVRSVFQEVARVCSQLRCTVAYLGPPATFTHQAARSRFGINADYVQCDRIPDVFAAVERGSVAW